MLSQDDLTAAVHDGLKSAEVCSNTFCRTGAVIENEGYTLAHNGVGSRDTDVQHIHATKTLNLSREQLAEQIKTWVVAVHNGTKVDLNAAMTTGEREAEVWCATCPPDPVTGAGHWHAVEIIRGPAIPGWPWRSDVAIVCEGLPGWSVPALTIAMTSLPPVEQRCRLRSALADTFRRETATGDDIAVDFVEPAAVVS